MSEITTVWVQTPKEGSSECTSNIGYDDQQTSTNSTGSRENMRIMPIDPPLLVGLAAAS